MGNLVLAGATSGSTTITPTDAVTATLTLPSTTGTLGLASGSATQSINAQNTFGFKNRIINGGMTIDQRNAGASVSVSTSGVYVLDRWKNRANGGGVYSVQQSSTAPAGFTNSSLYTVTTADSSIAASDNYWIIQEIEGYNVADLGFGTSDAKTVTFSFWVRSSVTGTFNVALSNGTTYDRSYVTTYTINSANTWEQKSVTIAGDTSGTWGKTNGGGITVVFTLGTGTDYQTTANTWVSGFKHSTAGSTNLIATNGATFYITGVQLEVGTQATSFDFRDYTRELQMCQRYYYGYVSSSNKLVGRGGYYSATQVEVAIFFPTTMRTMPTLVATSGTNYYAVYRGGGSNNINSLTLNGEGSGGSVSVYNATEASGTIGYAGVLVTNNTSSSVAFNSEL